MAMTKKEQAAMKEAIDRADLLAALRWTQAVTKDVAPPRIGYSEGWSANFGIVERAWTSNNSHGSGTAPAAGEKNRYGRRQPAWLYSTEALALAAMRHEIETQCAKKLMEIDRRIQALSEKE